DQGFPRAEKPMRTGVDRDRVWTVARDDRGKARGHVVDGSRARQRGERPIGKPPSRLPQPRRVIVLLEQRPALDAEVALRDRVLLVAAHLEHAVALDVDLDATDRVAEAAEALVRQHVQNGSRRRRALSITCWAACVGPKRRPAKLDDPVPHSYIP